MDVEIVSNLRIEFKVFFNHLIQGGKTSMKKFLLAKDEQRCYVFHECLFFDRYFLDWLKVFKCFTDRFNKMLCSNLFILKLRRKQLLTLSASVDCEFVITYKIYTVEKCSSCVRLQVLFNSQQKVHFLSYTFQIIK